MGEGSFVEDLLIFEQGACFSQLCLILVRLRELGISYLQSSEEEGAFNLRCGCCSTGTFLILDLCSSEPLR